MGKQPPALDAAARACLSAGVQGRVLIVAGSDSGGGAGLQADVKTVTALGAYAATAVTALTAQNTLGVHGVWPVPVAFIRQQMRVVLDDIGADAIKTGMLHDVDVIEGVVEELSAEPARLVVDPVMIAKGGASLLSERARGALLSLLVPRAAVITPNAPEAAALTGLRVEREADLVRAGEALLAAGAGAALMKGGHLDTPDVVDVLVTPAGHLALRASRIASRSTHGTGCTLASALAARLAQGAGLEDATRDARAFVRGAIAAAPGLGAGHGPLDHAFPFRSAR